MNTESRHLAWNYTVHFGVGANDTPHQDGWHGIEAR
jgi:hypothetical protein